MWGPRCEEHGIQCCRHPSCWFLKKAYCSASHDSSCCAYQMLITQCIASQPEACYPWLDMLIDIRSRTASEDLIPQWKNLFSVFLYGVIRVSLLTLYLVRIHAACLIVHGSIGECVVTAKDGILSLITARYVLASPRTVETAFSAAPLLCWLCVGDTCRRICQSCPSGRHSFATLSSSNCRTPSLSPCGQ